MNRLPEFIFVHKNAEKKLTLNLFSDSVKSEAVQPFVNRRSCVDELQDDLQVFLWHRRHDNNVVFANAESGPSRDDVFVGIDDVIFVTDFIDNVFVVPNVVFAVKNVFVDMDDVISVTDIIKNVFGVFADNLDITTCLSLIPQARSVAGLNVPKKIRLDFTYSRIVG